MVWTTNKIIRGNIVGVLNTVLQTVLVTAKSIHYINVSWWFILLPTIIPTVSAIIVLTSHIINKLRRR